VTALRVLDGEAGDDFAPPFQVEIDAERREGADGVAHHAEAGALGTECRTPFVDLDIDAGSAQGRGEGEPADSGPDHDDFRSLRCHGASVLL
jgi:hypothetical protein